MLLGDPKETLVRNDWGVWRSVTGFRGSEVGKCEGGKVTKLDSGDVQSNEIGRWKTFAGNATFHLAEGTFDQQKS